MYSRAITGTSFSVTETMRCTPPRKMNPATSATRMPTTTFRHAKGGEHGVADGVGLHHIAHKAQGQNDGHREEARQEFAEAIGEGCLDIIDRATHDLAFFIRAAVLLGQNRLGVVGGHAKRTRSPIQKMAPGPPETMAVAAPAMLPVPTWAATAVASA